MVEIISIGTSQPPRAARNDRGWTISLGRTELQCPADFGELLAAREHAMEEQLQVFDYNRRVGLIPKLPVELIVSDLPTKAMPGWHGVVLIQIPREHYAAFSVELDGACMLYDGREDEVGHRLPLKYPNVYFVFARERQDTRIEFAYLETSTGSQFRVTIDADGARTNEVTLDTRK